MYIVKQGANQHNAEFIFAHPIYLQGIPVKFLYKGYRVKVKVTGAKKVEKTLFPQCKTSVGINSGSVGHRAMNFACNMRFLAMAD